MLFWFLCWMRSQMALIFEIYVKSWPDIRVFVLIWCFYDSLLPQNYRNLWIFVKILQSQEGGGTPSGLRRPQLHRTKKHVPHIWRDSCLYSIFFGENRNAHHFLCRLVEFQKNRASRWRPGDTSCNFMPFNEVASRNFELVIISGLKMW